jgi:glycosyltransferase involved in cell wall biosynthesis
LDKPLFVNLETESPSKPLRILLLVNLRWDERLGAVRVYMNLANEWRAAGHVVEHYSLSDAFPGMSDSAAGFALRQLWFASRAKSFVRKNAGRFDVIDALIGSLPASKQELRFNGLLVARSVGLYRLYLRFEETARRRWPGRSRGKFLGRIFYTFTQRGLWRASDKAVRNADLVTVPNEEEASCLRREIDPALPLIVQPYGLTEEHRRALNAAAASAAERLSHRKISFIGMWAARKGAYDWPAIMRAVWRKIPDARFRFLGTMVEPQTILAELGVQSSEGIELVSKYSPVDLPALLADCAVGAFPSYIEGFGLAVLEQLAAGIPTVAFDVAGPRQVLGAQLPELLVRSGDVEAFASAICKILELDSGSYETLSQRSAKTAATFDWSHIAENSIAEYHERLGRRAPKILFVQPFGLGSPGGGARILRALLPAGPVHWTSVCTSPEPPEMIDSAREVHLPLRPYFGRIERSRLRFLPELITPLFKKKFVAGFERLCRRLGVDAIHAIPHTGLDFHHAHRVASKLGLPLYLQVHDDFAFSSRHAVEPQRAHAAMRSAWQNAAARFVICDQLGNEYCRRYGARDFIVVTDGLEDVAPGPTVRVRGQLRVYFMGLFHLEYEENLRVLGTALKRVQDLRSSASISITLRCGSLRPAVAQTARDIIRVLPFGTEADVRDDIENADLLYLPLPFDREFEPLVRFSLSTKLVTYLGSGLPILYHGPQGSAAYELLVACSAALFHTSLEIDSLTETLCRICDERELTSEISNNSLVLARSRFLLRDQRARFWNAIVPDSLSQAATSSERALLNAR